MKKFMVLALVLGVVGYANASLKWSFVDDSTSGVLKIYGDYPAAPYYIVITIGPKFYYPPFSGPSIYPPADISIVVGSDSPNLTQMVTATPVADGVTGLPEGAGVDFIAEAWTIASGLTTQPTLTHVNLLNVMNPNGFFPVRIYLLDDNFVATCVAEWSYIPEPVTIVLLGLGGLFVRRK